MTEYEYFIHVVDDGLSPDQGDELWRSRDGNWDFLSLVDWRWHSSVEPGLQIFPRNPLSLARVTAERAAGLEAGKQELVRYWTRTDPNVAVFRHRRLLSMEEVFRLDNTWGPTKAVGDFLYGRPGDTWDLTEIDVVTADRIIYESRGVAEATAL